MKKLMTGLLVLGALSAQATSRKFLTASSTLSAEKCMSSVLLKTLKNSDHLNGKIIVNNAYQGFNSDELNKVSFDGRVLSKITGKLITDEGVRKFEGEARFNLINVLDKSTNQKISYCDYVITGGRENVAIQFEDALGSFILRPIRKVSNTFTSGNDPDLLLHLGSELCNYSLFDDCSAGTMLKFRPSEAALKICLIDESADIKVMAKCLEKAATYIDGPELEMIGQTCWGTGKNKLDCLRHVFSSN